jgi:uncharacterized protein YxjI
MVCHMFLLQTTWAVAKKDCMTVFGAGASLVSIESQVELNFLKDKLALTDSTGKKISIVKTFDFSHCAGSDSPIK